MECLYDKGDRVIAQAATLTKKGPLPGPPMPTECCLCSKEGFFLFARHIFSRVSKGTHLENKSAIPFHVPSLSEPEASDRRQQLFLPPSSPPPPSLQLLSLSVSAFAARRPGVSREGEFGLGLGGGQLRSSARSVGGPQIWPLAKNNSRGGKAPFLESGVEGPDIGALFFGGRAQNAPRGRK